MAAKLNEDELNLAAYALSLLIVWTRLADRYSTLVPEEIPAKLRCGLCNLVAVNAVKLPCCETSICDKCELTCDQNTLQEYILTSFRPSRAA